MLKKRSAVTFKVKLGLLPLERGRAQGLGDWEAKDNFLKRVKGGDPSIEIRLILDSNLSFRINLVQISAS